MSEDSDLFEETIHLLFAGYVERYHIAPGITQTLNSHVARLTTLAFLLHPNPSIELIRYLTFHDCAERVCGDLPGTAKRLFPGLKKIHAQAELIALNDTPRAKAATLEISEDDRHWAKALDILEAMMYCWDQCMLGNEHGRVLAVRLDGWLREYEHAPYEVITFANWYNENAIERSLA